MSELLTKGLSSLGQTLLMKGLGGILVVPQLPVEVEEPGHGEQVRRRRPRRIIRTPFEIEYDVIGTKFSLFEINYPVIGTKEVPLTVEHEVKGRIVAIIDETVVTIGTRQFTTEEIAEVKGILETQIFQAQYLVGDKGIVRDQEVGKIHLVEFDINGDIQLVHQTELPLAGTKFSKLHSIKDMHGLKKLGDIKKEMLVKGKLDFSPIIIALDTTYLD